MGHNVWKKYDKRNNSDTLKYRSDNVLCFLLRNWAFHISKKYVCKVLSNPRIFQALSKGFEFATFALSTNKASFLDVKSNLDHSLLVKSQ